MPTEERWTFEDLMMHPDGFGLVKATPVQRAIFRVSTGMPIGERLWKVPAVQQAFGGGRPEDGVTPLMLILCAAIWSGKSLWAAARAFWAATTGDLSQTQLSDEIRIPIVSTEKDSAGSAFAHLVKMVTGKPKLRERMLSEPTNDTIWLKHQDGDRPIEVKVTALSRYASTLVGRRMPAVIFDEAPRMVGEDHGVRNLTEALRAVRGRILPGGMIMMPGSPWAPYGPIYDLVQEHFGKPSEDICVIRCTGPAMNPSIWTPEKVEALRRTDPRAYKTDCLGEFADAEDAMFSSIEIEAATRKDLLITPPKPRHFYCAAMDPATRGNAWTLMCLECSGEDDAGKPRYSVAFAKQWKGSKSAPLKATAVLAEAAELLKPYGVDTIWTDQHQVDTLTEIGAELGLFLNEHAFNRENRFEMAERVRIMISERRLELPPDPQVRRDLVATVRKVTQNGVTLELPNTGDGRHADYVPTLCLTLQHAPLPPLPELITTDEDEFFRKLVESERDRANDPISQHIARLTGS